MFFIFVGRHGDFAHQSDGEGYGTDQYGNEPIWGLAFYAWVAIIYTLIIVAMARLNTGRKAATSYEEKNRYLFFIVGAGFRLLGGVFDILLTFWLSLSLSG